ncbi:MAG: lipoyl(octanoyl) transferase LipB [Verrucomicrobia bacterium]|nr:lipoyl(octanoyl) transferase LipB [Verrucomicrobiota bacterium]
MSTWCIHFSKPLSYAQGVSLQERLVSARTSGAIPDTVLFLEHEPVVTLGRRGRDNFLNVTPEYLKEEGIELHQSSRGGDVTYHAPGQIVMYPIMKLGTQEADAHGYLWNLEEIAIRTAGDFGVSAVRREGMNGAWAEHGKIAAIGFHLKRWITMHGMSFNVNIDLAGFANIVPCGLVGEPVASLESILGDDGPSLEEVRDAMSRHFSEICQREPQIFATRGELPATLADLTGECLAYL